MAPKSKPKEEKKHLDAIIYSEILAGVKTDILENPLLNKIPEFAGYHNNSNHLRDYLSSVNDFKIPINIVTYIEIRYKDRLENGCWARSDIYQIAIEVNREFGKLLKYSKSLTSD